jgi:hypothetical protein
MKEPDLTAKNKPELRIGPGPAQGKPVRVRLPGFILEDETLGAGDAVKRLTRAMGMKPCGSCEQRAAVLNRWIVFTRQPNR